MNCYNISKVVLFSSVLTAGKLSAQDQLQIQDQYGLDLSSQSYLSVIGDVFGQGEETYYLNNISNTDITNIQSIISEDENFGFNVSYFSGGNDLQPGESLPFTLSYDTISGLENGAKLSILSGATPQTQLEVPLFASTVMDGTDIGSPHQVGSTTRVKYDQLTITAGGQYLGLGADQYRFVRPSFSESEDVLIQARIDSVDLGSAASRAGLMIRDNAAISAGAEQSYAFIWMQPDGRVSMQYRDGSTSQFLQSASGGFTAGELGSPKWLRLKRSGDTFTGYYSQDGQDWEKFASVDIVMATLVKPGLAANEGGFTNTATTTARVSEFSIRDLKKQDIGNPAVSGSTAFSNDVYTLKASGRDIWNTSDQFHFRSEGLLGDGEVLTRVTSLSNRHSWTKAGVMMRSSSSASAANVAVFMRPDRRVVMQVRRADGELTENISGSTNIIGNTTDLKWLKITRNENVFTGFYSVDGVTWVAINTVELDLPIYCQAGLALTSHVNRRLATARFSNFSVNKYSEIIEAYWEFENITTHTGDETENRHQAEVNNAPSVAGINGNALGFTGNDSYVDIPPETFNVIQNEISISMWVKGDNTQARADSVFYATDENGDRVINIHLPWSNSRVYWDCGRSTSGGYDRIFKAASAGQFKNDWNHWVFTKNAATGKMAIYLNGSLWHSGTSNTGKIQGITEATISTKPNSGINSYDGSIDSVQIYRVELSADEVNDLYEGYQQ